MPLWGSRLRGCHLRREIRSSDWVRTMDMQAFLATQRRMPSPDIENQGTLRGSTCGGRGGRLGCYRISSNFHEPNQVLGSWGTVPPISGDNVVRAAVWLRRLERGESACPEKEGDYRTRPHACHAPAWTLRTIDEGGLFRDRVGTIFALSSAGGRLAQCSNLADIRSP